MVKIFLCLEEFLVIFMNLICSLALLFFFLKFNVLNNRVYGIYCNVITVHNENTHRLWGYGSVGQLLNIVLVTLRRAGY